MTLTINIHKARSDFSKLLRRVLIGEEVIIARSGVPIARIVPIQAKPLRRVPGSAKGKIRIAADFSVPLPEEFLAAFEGAESGL